MKGLSAKYSSAKRLLEMAISPKSISAKDISEKTLSGKSLYTLKIAGPVGLTARPNEVKDAGDLCVMPGLRTSAEID